MPRKYIRKTTRGEGGRWTQEDMSKAIDHAMGGLCTISQAAVLFGVPRSTLHLKMKGWSGKKPRKPTDGIIGGGGRGISIPLDSEKKLVKYLERMNKWGFGLSKTQVLDVVQTFVEKSTVESVFKNNRPGDDWWDGFCSRHKLSLKKPERLEGSRARQSGDPFVVEDFYDKLEQVIDELGLTGKPQCVYNCDETGINSDPGPTRIVSKKGVPAQRVTGGSGREFTTVLACVSANGEKMPPLILHKGKRMWTSMFGNKDKEYPGTSYYVSDKGWMTEDVFTSWFKKSFIPNVKELPALLIYDGHLSHISVDLVEEAIRSQITILKLPPHTSHFLQPLDVSVFRGFKSKWDKILTEWQRHNAGQRLPKSSFSNLLGSTWKSVEPSQIISGFKKTGIFDNTLQTPVNRRAVSEETYHPEKLDRYKKFVNEKRINSPTGGMPVLANCAGESAFTINNGTPTNSSSSSSLGRFESLGSPDSCQVIETPGKSFERILLKTVSQTTNGPKKCKRRIDVAEVITQTDYLINLKELKSQQNAKKFPKVRKTNPKLKGTVRKAKAVQEFSDSEMEDDVLPMDSDEEVSAKRILLQ